MPSAYLDHVAHRHHFAKLAILPGGQRGVKQSDAARAFRSRISRVPFPVVVRDRYRRAGGIDGGHVGYGNRNTFWRRADLIDVGEEGPSRNLRRSDVGRHSGGSWRGAIHCGHGDTGQLARSLRRRGTGRDGGRSGRFAAGSNSAGSPLVRGMLGVYGAARAQLWHAHATCRRTRRLRQRWGERGLFGCWRAGNFTSVVDGARNREGGGHEGQD